VKLQIRQTRGGSWQYRIATADGTFYISPPHWAKGAVIEAGEAHLEHLEDPYPDAWTTV
jgi:hypothetical protein